jgi:deoxycytidine triphosphate deaminase
VPFVIEHGQRVCKLTFDRMLEAPKTLYGEAIGSSYQRQEETLGKIFRRHEHAPDLRHRERAPRDGRRSSR